MTGPSLRVERRLMRDGARLVCGMDEVGRGALAGPVSVGAVVVDAGCASLTGVRDSKLLTPTARARLVPRILGWAVACGVGHASAAEVDDVGLVAALRMAGQRALALLDVRPDAILLDGSHDWLSPPPQLSLLAETDVDVPTVTMRVKADLSCTSVAAASVVAKVERDGVMVALAERYPGYGWQANKGYASEEHLAALARLGACPMHRQTWRLGVGREGGS